MSYPEHELVEAHSVVETSSCKNFSAYKYGSMTNTNYYNGINRTKITNIACPQGNKPTISFLKGPKGLCVGLQPYTAQCLAEDEQPGMDADAELAASSAGIKPDSYGEPDKMVFDKAVIYRTKDGSKTANYFSQATIYFKRARLALKEGHTAPTRQLKELILNVEHSKSIPKPIWYGSQAEKKN
jgi:hypothetical protein